MTARTTGPLLAYCTGIWAYCALHVLSRAFYSLQQPATPARVAAAMVGLNLALNLTLVWPLGAAGLAAATAVCAALQVVVLWRILGRRVKLSGGGRLVATAVKTCIATALMWLACRGVLGLLPALPPEGGIALKVLRLAAPVGAGLLVYLAAAALLRTEELHALSRHFLRGGGGD
jgi:putative peptidoglycan lipid II flippase